MSVLVDTPIWSLALRRPTGRLTDAQRLLVGWLEDLVRRRQARIIGMIRQEVLSGIPDRRLFERLRLRMRAFDDVPLETADHEEAARYDAQCRASGVAASSVDLLICAVAVRRSLEVFTLDRDFERYVRLVPLALHRPRD